MEITAIFSSVDNYCRDCALKLHLLHDILMISLCAVLSGAENDEEIATYGQEKKEFLGTFLSLPHGIPSDDIFTQVLRLLDTDKFAQCLYEHSRELLEFLQEHQLIYQIDIKPIEVAKMEVFEFIEVWYNRKRIYASLGYLTPNEYETKLNSYQKAV